MTYHIRTPDYHCSKCKFVFIPFEKGLLCPMCSTPEESSGEAYHFIDNLIRSMKVHKREFGTYKPSAWLQSTHTEPIQGVIFQCLDHMDANPGKTIQDIIDTFRIVEIDREHQDVRQLRRILTILRGREDEWRHTDTEGWQEKTRRWIRQFLP